MNHPKNIEIDISESKKVLMDIKTFNIENHLTPYQHVPVQYTIYKYIYIINVNTGFIES